MSTSRTGTLVASALCVGLISRAVLAQPDLERAAALEEQIHEQIASEQTQSGAHAETLIPLYTELGHLYEGLGEKARAAAAFEEARGVIRANRGLSSLDEAPLLEELIRIEEQLGDVEEAWRREHTLLDLADMHSDDLRAADIFEKIGDKRVRMLNRYLAGEFPPQLVLGCYYHRAPPDGFIDMREKNCTAGSRGTLIRGVMAEAWQYYSAAIDTLVGHKLYSSPELRDLEMRMVLSSYALGAYSVGRESLRRLRSYDVASGAPELEQAESTLRIADWNIVASQKRGTRLYWDSALASYEGVYAKLLTDGVDPESIAALFGPEVPVVLPTFQPNPLASQRTADTTGQIDVAFEITRFGRAKHVDVLEATTHASRDAERALVHEISRSVFRPRIVDGRVADAAPVVLRYYVAERLATADGRAGP